MNMDVYELIKYGGECPDCGEWYEFDNELDTDEEFECPECKGKFEINLIK